MLYDYTCTKCGAVWEENYPMVDRDKPVGQPCPEEHCSKKNKKCDGTISREVTAPGLNYQGSVSAIRRAGSHWNDVLKGIKKASGRENTIEHY